MVVQYLLAGRLTDVTYLSVLNKPYFKVLPGNNHVVQHGCRLQQPKPIIGSLFRVPRRLSKINRSALLDEHHNEPSMGYFRNGRTISRP